MHSDRKHHEVMNVSTASMRTTQGPNYLTDHDTNIMILVSVATLVVNFSPYYIIMHGMMMRDLLSGQSNHVSTHVHVSAGCNEHALLSIITNFMTLAYRTPPSALQ